MRESGNTLPPAVYLVTEAPSNGHDPDSDAPLHIMRNALRGIEVETEETARLEAERKAAMQRISGALRAVLADRMVTAPAEELDATDALRAARKRIYGTSSTPSKEQSRG
jgi:hypothetical protein